MEMYSIDSHAYLKYLLKLAENMKYMRGLAAELRGARLWMKVATVPTVSLFGSSSYTWSMSNIIATVSSQPLAKVKVLIVLPIFASKLPLRFLSFFA